NDSRLSQAALECLKKEGLGAGASRLVCGNMTAHQELEEKLARFKGSQGCLLFSSGYMANVGVISSLFGRDDMIFCDRLNHASIIDGILLSQAQYKRYPHVDMDALDRLLQEAPATGKKCIITDSVFSMDGDLAPLDKIVELAKKYQAIVMIDEAHAFGVFGKHGKGLAEHFGVEKEIEIQMGTLSKAAGCFGAYVCGSRDLITYLINQARSFIYTTAMPPSIAAAAAKAIDIIENDHFTRERLHENARYLRAQLKLMGFNTVISESPIIPLVIGESHRALEFSQRLLRKGIFVSAIRPPTVPEHTARLRLTAMAAHTKDEIDFTLGQIQRIGKELKII
ncbi:MAG: 8-amino-7-oxononanoate synthase, partial [Candidatus Omnitrophota bacterium]|nr:8-amino-7-oxononanoate synthase [Candidatus Omnitrophota bacterium]